MNARVTEIRRKFQLSQQQFGEKIGLKQKAISQIEAGQNNLTERNFETICSVFNVNPEWLRKGEGEMFLPPKTETYLEQLAKEHGLNAREKALIQSILDLPPEIRSGVIDWALNLAKKLDEEMNLTPEEKELRDLKRQKDEINKRISELEPKLDAKNYLEEPGAG